METMSLYEVMKAIDVAIIFYACIAIAINGIIWFIQEVFDLVKTVVRKRRERRKAEKAETAAEETNNQ